MDMSKDWMDTPRHKKEYQVGIERFLHFAFSSKGVPQGEEIQCPCAKCCNRLWLKRNDVYDHLICHGFVKGYRRWFNHGESLFAIHIDSDIDGEYNCNDNIDELLREEPSRDEVFIATRTSKKGKEIDAKTQATITELQNHLEAGENEEDVFVGVLGKDQPGRVRCYGTSITRSSLKKDEEIRHIKVEYNAKVSSLEKKMDGVCGLLKVLVHQLNPGMSDEEVAALVQAAQDSPLDTSSSRVRNTPRSSESTHIPHKDDGTDQNNLACNDT